MSSAGKEFDEQFRLLIAEKAQPVQDAMECMVMDLRMLAEKLSVPLDDDDEDAR